MVVQRTIDYRKYSEKHKLYDKTTMGPPGFSKLNYNYMFSG